MLGALPQLVPGAAGGLTTRGRTFVSRNREREEGNGEQTDRGEGVGRGGEADQVGDAPDDQRATGPASVADQPPNPQERPDRASWRQIGAERHHRPRADAVAKAHDRRREEQGKVAVRERDHRHPQRQDDEAGNDRRLPSHAVHQDPGWNEEDHVNRGGDADDRPDRRDVQT